MSNRSRFHPPQSLLAALLLAALLPSACAGGSSASAPSTSPATGPAGLVLPPGVAPIQFDVVEMTIKNKEFTIEVADNGDKTERGLMFRKSMPADHGMIFVFDIAKPYSFWMANTYIPLDIIYLDINGKVIAIHDRKPLDERGMAPPSPALYVIELNEGTANQLGLKLGDVVGVPGKYLKRGPVPVEN